MRMTTRQIKRLEGSCCVCLPEVDWQKLFYWNQMVLTAVWESWLLERSWHGWSSSSGLQPLLSYPCRILWLGAGCRD